VQQKGGDNVQQKGGDMNEVTGPCVGVKFTSLTPSDVADSVENERNRLLAPVMMDSRPSAGLDRKNAAPQGRIDEGYRCNSRAAFRTRRLGGAKVELRGADNANCFVIDHGSSGWS
jgi:hypothetical protein